MRCYLQAGELTGSHITFILISSSLFLIMCVGLFFGNIWYVFHFVAYLEAFFEMQIVGQQIVGHSKR